MEEVRRVLRPWPERMTASAPLLIPALSLLCACAAMDVSLWFWIPCFCLASLPCFLRAPSMGVLAVALAMWAAVYLFAYEREYAGVPVEAGRVMVMEGSVEAFSGKSVLFRPDGSRWLYAVSSRDGARPPAAGGGAGGRENRAPAGTAAARLRPAAADDEGVKSGEKS